MRFSAHSPLAADDLQLLRDVAEAAGREIMAVYEQGGAVWSKADSSPLTEADLRADRIIRDRLTSLFPGAFILSEESQSGEGGAPDAFFLVDPLDGTKEFLDRTGEFTVNVAFVREGRPIAGVVHAPALGETFFALRGGGAWKAVDGGARRVSVRKAEGQRLRIVGSRSHGLDALTSWLSRLPRAHDFVAVGSALKFCRIAEGDADLYARFGPTSQWDTAAGQAILEEAGGAVTDFSGAPLLYGLDRPLLNPDFIAAGDIGLLQGLQRAP